MIRAVAAGWLALSVAGALVATPTVITFEDLPASGPGTGLQTVLTDQFRNLGVVFDRAALLDFSQGSAIPDFAHSGTKAIMHCYAIEFCHAPFAFQFTSPQSRIKVWVGYDDRLPEGGRVVLTALDSQNNVVGRAVDSIPANQRPVPIRIPLEVRTAEPVIASAALSVEGFQAGITSLAADDLEFERISPPDLEIESVASRADESGHVEIVVGVKNVGEQASPPTVVQAVSEGWPMATGDVKELATGETASVEIRIPEPLAPDTYQFRVLVDPDGKTGDTNRNNNAQSGEVVVTAPPPPPTEPPPPPTEPPPPPAEPESASQVTFPPPLPTPAPEDRDATILWIVGILLGAGLISMLVRLSRAKSPSRPVARPVFRPVWEPGSQEILPDSSPRTEIDLRIRTRPGTSSREIEVSNPPIEETEES